MPSVDVVIAWGDDILFASRAQHSLYVGDEGPVDFAVARETLGAARIQLVGHGSAGVIVTVPRCSHVELSTPSVSAFRHDLPRRPTSDKDWEELVLPFGARVAFHLGALHFVVTHGDALIAPSLRRRRESTLWGCAVASLAVHLALVTAISAAPPASLEDDSALLDRETAAYLQQKNLRAARVVQHGFAAVESDTPSHSSGGGARHHGEQGLLASASHTSAGRYAIKGPPETAEARLARVRADIDANHYGVLGVLAAALSNAPPDVGDETLGRDPSSFNGLMRADHDGDALGFKGLGLYGAASGGGGDAAGIGLGHVGDFGHGAGGMAHGDGYGTGMGWGGGGGRLGMRRTKVIRCFLSTEVVMTGQLPPESVRRIVRASHDRFRRCYEAGLQRDPSLRGRVQVRFIIDATGAVETASLTPLPPPDAPPDKDALDDDGVRACTLGVFESMSFPEPVAGKILVTYPIDYELE